MTTDTPTRPRLQDIIRATCEITKTSPSVLFQEGRHFCRPRQVASFVAKRHGYTLKAIGGALYRDPGTILSSCDTIRVALATDRGFLARTIEQIDARARKLTKDFRYGVRSAAIELARAPPPPPSPRYSRPEQSSEWDPAFRAECAQNEARFVAAMRAAHPEMERGKVI